MFTNGCFDLLHAGHIAALESAAELGDSLVVGLNSDRSVRELKGPGRPVRPECDRARMLAALRSVDAVVRFDAPSPLELIEALRPDIYVKGADYHDADLPEARAVAAAGGRVVYVELTPGYSTTREIERLSAPHRRTGDV